jgi:hypothetical protein
MLYEKMGNNTQYKGQQQRHVSEVEIGQKSQAGFEIGWLAGRRRFFFRGRPRFGKSGGSLALWLLWNLKDAENINDKLVRRH